VDPISGLCSDAYSIRLCAEMWRPFLHTAYVDADADDDDADQPLDQSQRQRQPKPPLKPDLQERGGGGGGGEEEEEEEEDKGQREAAATTRGPYTINAGRAAAAVRGHAARLRHLWQKGVAV